MPKFVILGGVTRGFSASAKAAGAFFSYASANPFLKQAMRVHLSGRINDIIPLPFSSIWSKLHMRNIPVGTNDDAYFILSEGLKISYNMGCLKYLRSRYKNAKLIQYFTNPMIGPSMMTRVKYWEKVRDLYDAAITVNKSDAEKYGILYTDYWPCLLPPKSYQPENASDVFFIGQAKNRLPQILSVYERLTDAGLKCDFWITGVPERERKYSEYIHYHEEASYTWMSYDEVLQRDMNTKCILEILPFSQNYSSLRPMEAMTYRKKLLTTNLNAPSEWFYHPEIVQVFTRTEDINTDFIRQSLTPQDEHRIFGNMNIGDFSVFADFLVRNVHRKDS